MAGAGTPLTILTESRYVRSSTKGLDQSLSSPRCTVCKTDVLLVWVKRDSQLLPDGLRKLTVSKVGREEVGY